MFASCTDEKEIIVNDNLITETRAESCGFEAPLNQGICQFLTQSYQLVYLGCTINYTVAWYKCELGITMNAPVYDQNLLCPNIQQMIHDAYMNGGAQAAAAIFNDIAKALSNDAQIKVLSPFNGFFSQWYCSGPCTNNPNGIGVSFTAIEATCSSICYGRSKGDQFGRITYITCGTGCCKRRTRFCIRQNNFTPCFGAPIIEPGEPCSLLPWPSDLCTNPPVCNSPCDKL